jgi:hypothetical protein
MGSSRVHALRTRLHGALELSSVELPRCGIYAQTIAFDDLLEAEQELAREIGVAREAHARQQADPTNGFTGVVRPSTPHPLTRARALRARRRAAGGPTPPATRLPAFRSCSRGGDALDAFYFARARACER